MKEYEALEKELEKIDETIWDYEMMDRMDIRQREAWEELTRKRLVILAEMKRIKNA